jgi:hypothetical protein
MSCECTDRACPGHVGQEDCTRDEYHFYVLYRVDGDTDLYIEEEKERPLT